MMATYALDLTATSADLFCRRDGGWIAAGSIPLPEADFGARLLDLLAAAGAPKGVRVAVALPPDEVLVLTAPFGRDSAAGRARAALLLDGRSNPDAVRIDWAEGAEGLDVAATSLTILHEAETFLAGLGLEPAGCGARFGTVPFAVGAWFGFSDEPTRPDGRAPRPDFLPLPWTQPVAAAAEDHDQPEIHATWAGHPAEEPADVDLDAGGFTPPAFTAPPAPQPAAEPGSDAYLAARARAKALARRTPVAFAPMTDEVVETPLVAPRRFPVPALVPDRGVTPEAARGRHLRRVAVLGACLVAGLAAASALPDRLWPFGGETDPTGGDGAVWDSGAGSAESAVWLAPDSGDAAGTMAQGLSPDDPDYVLASFSPAAAYAAPALPVDMVALSIPGIDKVYRADALALQDPGRKPAAKAPPVGLTKPTVAHEAFAYDERGLIRPTRGGTLSPEGFKVYAGAPPRSSVPRPERSEAIPPVVIVAEDSTPAAADPLGRVVPRTRPAGLSERFERARLGGKTEQELAAAAPRQRPASAQETAAAQAPAASAPSSYAIASAPRPASRSDDAYASFTLARANPVEIPDALAPLAMSAVAPVAAPPKAPPAPGRTVIERPAPVRPAAAAPGLVPTPAPARPGAVRAAQPRTEIAAATPVMVEPAAPAPTQSSRAQAQALAQAQAKADAQARAEAAALAQAQAQAQARAEAQAQTQARALAQAQAKADAQARAKAEAQAQAQAKAEAKAQAKALAQAQAQAKAEAQARAKAEAQAQAQAKAQAQAQAKAQAQAQAKAKAASKQSQVTMVASSASGATPADVQARATDADLLDLSEVNLLGTFGSSADARAIVRMPNGKVMNVAVGDKLNGGRVAGIGEGELYYVKRGKTLTLQMPRG